MIITAQRILDLHPCRIRDGRTDKLKALVGDEAERYARGELGSLCAAELAGRIAQRTRIEINRIMREIR